MKPLLKKQPPAPVPWHPDFRDAATLPDVKVVRTRFFINGFSILLFAAMALLLGYHEFQRHALHSEVKVLEEQISQNRARSEELLALQRQFTAHERFISELSTYLDASLAMSEFLLALGETLPEEMNLSALRYYDITERGQVVGKQMVLNGSISGTPEAAATIITDYLRVFEQEPRLAERVERAVPTSLIPTPEGDMMIFGIQLTFKSNKPEETKAAGAQPGRNNG